MQIKPVIDSFQSYREFLKALFEYKRSTSGIGKSGHPAFSHRVFSKAAGLGSPNYLLMIIQGKRSLGAEGAVKVAKGLDMDVAETRKFLNMVYLESDKQFQKQWDVCSSTHESVSKE